MSAAPADGRLLVLPPGHVGCPRGGPRPKHALQAADSGFIRCWQSSAAPVLEQRQADLVMGGKRPSSLEPQASVFPPAISSSPLPHVSSPLLNAPCSTSRCCPKCPLPHSLMPSSQLMNALFSTPNAPFFAPERFLPFSAPERLLPN
eukprot:365161-Chlamydomonas_euryale.AAC.7